MIIFATDDDKRIDLAVQLRQPLKHCRGGAALVFLVHAVKQRQAFFGCVHYGGRVPAPTESRCQIADDPNAGPRFAYRTVDNRDVQRHDGSPIGWRSAPKSEPRLPNENAEWLTFR